MYFSIKYNSRSKEAIRLWMRGGGGGGAGRLKKLILQNNVKSLKIHYRLVINGVYATRHCHIFNHILTQCVR